MDAHARRRRLARIEGGAAATLHDLHQWTENTFALAPRDRVRLRDEKVIGSVA